jgi:hypothetical protein
MARTVQSDHACSGFFCFYTKHCVGGISKRESGAATGAARIGPIASAHASAFAVAIIAAGIFLHKKDDIVLE